ncbi:MAG TPA: FGGY-family carbohydrate kinase [Anaerolineaceae bacterium]|nr:FGGY-family carbohydrate kinase [Anaerolineaceae bacterium]
MSALLGLDIGTTTIKALLYDTEAGHLLSMAARPTPVEHPAPTWSQHDPESLWQTVLAVLREASIGQSPIDGLAVTGFAEAGLPLDKSGQPLYPIISWYDRRTEAQADWWEQKIPLVQLHAITGQRVSPSFGVNKWMWIRENQPGLEKQLDCWLSVEDYILYKLTGEKATDFTLGSRTLLFDQRDMDWSSRMLDLAGIEKSQMPRLQPSGTMMGKITAEAANETGLPVGMPCILGGHDHLVAALAAGAYRPGVIIDSSGTAEAVLMVLDTFHTGVRISKRGYAAYAHVVKDQYVLKAGLKAAGGGIEWLASQLAGPGADLSDLPYDLLALEALRGVGRQVGPVWLPHLNGSGTPESDRYSRAALVGVQIEHERGDLFRAFLESLACWLRHNIEEMETLTGQKVEKVIHLGGTSRIRLLVKLKANLLKMPISVPTVPEAAATGAALLAGLGLGIFSTQAEAVASLSFENILVEPDISLTGWYDRIYKQLYLPLYPALYDLNIVMTELATDL